MTPSQQRFVDEYVIDLDEGAAYLRAGYQAKSMRVAQACGGRLLRDPEIAGEIDRILDRRRQQTGGTAADFDRLPRTLKQRLVRLNASSVIQETSLLAFSSIGDYFDFKGDTVRMRPGCEITDEALRAVASIKVKRYIEGPLDEGREVEVTELKLWDKNTALGTLAKACGLFRKRPTLEEVCDVLDLHKPGLGERLKASILDERPAMEPGSQGIESSGESEENVSAPDAG